jgi:putative methionine-R-sulfoxide reductase with GAF domain
MLDGAVINDVVGDDRMVTVFDADSRTALTYFSEIDHQLLSIYAVEAEGLLPVEFMDVETRSPGY